MKKTFHDFLGDLGFRRLCDWLLGWTPLGALNYFILQWFFIRVCSNEDRVREITDVRIDSASIIRGFNGRSGDIGMAYSIRNSRTKVTTWYSIMYFVAPCSGWGGDYRYIGRNRFWDITKKVTRIIPNTH